MALLYIKEHTGCYNYEKGSSPVVGKSTFAAGEEWNFASIKNKIIFLAEGEYKFSYSQYRDKVVSGGQMLLIPAGAVVTGVIEKPTTLYTLRLHDVKNLCECFSLDMLLREEDENTHKDLFLLNSNERIIKFFDLWGEFISEGLLCKYYLNLKSKELFYLLRAYHTKGDLLEFFYPLLSNDMTFSDFVIRNHFKVKTVNELAERANYSLSGFQKRFKRVFGTSAYNWMKEEKLKAIFHEINNTDATFKEISSKYGFSSPSHFNDFCKSNFGHTPGILRKNKINLRIIKE